MGDVIPNNGLQELVVGSFDGHLFVFGLHSATGAILMPPIHQTQVEGSVGAYNSIVIADLNSDSSNEPYVAGSLGLRKWVFQ